MSEIHLGFVKKVDAVNFSVDVYSSVLGHLTNVQYASSSFNSLYGSGIIFSPCIGAGCMLTQLADGRWVIIGFLSPGGPLINEDGTPIKDVLGTMGYNSGRPRNWNPGDVGMVGPFGKNFIKSEITGRLTIQAGHICRLDFIPATANLASLICDNLELYAGNNKLFIHNDRNKKSSDFELVCQSVPDQDTQVVKIQMGKKAGLLKILIDDTIVVSVDKEKAVTISGSVFKVKIGSSDVISVDKNKTVKINNSLTVKP